MKKNNKTVKLCWDTILVDGKEVPCNKKTPHSSGLCYQHRKEMSRDDSSE